MNKNIKNIKINISVQGISKEELKKIKKDLASFFKVIEYTIVYDGNDNIETYILFNFNNFSEIDRLEKYLKANNIKYVIEY